MRLAVAMWSASSTLRGRPNLVPLTREAARLRAVRSLVSSRSYSASEPRTPIIILPAAVEESMPSVTGRRGPAAGADRLPGRTDEHGRHPVQDGSHHQRRPFNGAEGAVAGDPAQDRWTSRG